MLPKGETGELLIASPESLREVSFTFDTAAASTLSLEGGTVASVTMTPDGGVAFDVTIDESPVRHPVWWSREMHTFSSLRLSMPQAKGATVFSIGSSR